MFLPGDSKPVRHAARDVQTGTEDAAILATAKSNPPEKGKTPAQASGTLDISSINLSGMTSAENPTQGAVANLPRTQGGNSRQC
jgi:hypothetical protein